MALKRQIVRPGPLPAVTVLAAALTLPFPALAQIDPNDGNSYATPPQMAPPAANTRDGASIGTVETVKPVAGGNRGVREGWWRTSTATLRKKETLNSSSQKPQANEPTTVLTMRIQDTIFRK